jgi:hypothetical protein
VQLDGADRNKAEERIEAIDLVPNVPSRSAG